MKAGTKRAAAPAAVDKRARVVSEDSKKITEVEPDGLEYQSGFGNEFASEAIKGALPPGQNAPQRCAFGLYAEQLSGSAFTVPRAGNKRTWLYRIRPSVVHESFVKVDHPGMVSNLSALKVDPNQMRWLPPDISGASHDWVEGLRTVGGNGVPGSNGIAIYLYTANANMGRRVFNNSDGEMLVVPQEGRLIVRTEAGRMTVAPREICVLPRGMRVSIDVEGPSRGYVCEIFAGNYRLPDLGPIGANGLANPRDFVTPVAWYEDVEAEHTIVNKFGGEMFEAKQGHSPFDVVAWHGNFVPYKYNLDLFNCMNSVTYDHPDPSIYTVLTAPTTVPGVALCDFVIFPPRWMVMERSFRPPYYHRNVMSEYMGMIYGSYDAKVGFKPGGGSLHSPMTPHGPDAPTFAKASTADLKPDWFSGGLAFMFETSLQIRLTDYALDAPFRDADYTKCWKGLPKLFDPENPHAGITKEIADEVVESAAQGGGKRP